MILDMITTVIGTPPVGWEFVPYIVAAILFLVFFALIARIFTLLFSFWRR